MSTAAILLAAGRGSRMGGATPKQLLRLGDRPLLERTLEIYLAAGLDEIVVVTGYAGDEVAAAVDPRVRVVENGRWESGLGASLACGAAALGEGIERALVGLADMPWVTPSVIRSLLERSESIVAPTFDGERGHPVLFGRRWFPELCRLEGDRGAGGILARHSDELALVAVEEPGVLRDLDRPEDVPHDLPVVALRGGGDLATGVAHVLYTAGYPVVVLELAQPRMLRTSVSFSQAVYTGRCTVEGVTARRFFAAPSDRRTVVPVLVDPNGDFVREHRPPVLVDARLLKAPGDLSRDDAELVVALGPGIEAGRHCHVVIETNRGPRLGEPIWSGAAEADTGVPGLVGGETVRRVVRSPETGRFRRLLAPGERVRQGDVLGWVENQPVLSLLDGMLRGVVHSGLEVVRGEKIADVDPRLDAPLEVISDKARTVGRGVLSAVRKYSSY